MTLLRQFLGNLKGLKFKTINGANFFSVFQIFLQYGIENCQILLKALNFNLHNSYIVLYTSFRYYTTGQCTHFTISIYHEVTQFTYHDVTEY